jgi:hypothetical protein
MYEQTVKQKERQSLAKPKHKKGLEEAMDSIEKNPIEYHEKR